MASGGSLLVTSDFSQVRCTVCPSVFGDIAMGSCAFLQSFGVSRIVRVACGGRGLAGFVGNVFRSCAGLFDHVVRAGVFTGRVHTATRVSSARGLSSRGLNGLRGFVGGLFNTFQRGTFTVIPGLGNFGCRRVISNSGNNESIRRLSGIGHSLVSSITGVLNVPASLIRKSVTRFRATVGTCVGFYVTPLIGGVRSRLGTGLVSGGRFLGNFGVRIGNIARADMVRGSRTMSGLITSKTFAQGRIHRLFKTRHSSSPRLSGFIVAGGCRSASTIRKNRGR